MANLIKFFEKARSIYAAMKLAGSRGRNAWNEAQHQASLYFKALKKGVVTFMKLNGTIATRKVEPIENHYQFKSDKKESNGLIKLWDMTKNAVISFHAWQMI